MIATYKGTIHKVFGIEKTLIRELSEFRIAKNDQFDGYGWTETFKGVDVQTILERCDDLNLMGGDELLAPYRKVV